MLEQLLSIKLSSQRSLVGGMAPYCPQRELDALPHAFALIIILAVVCVHQEPMLSSSQLSTHSGEAGTTHHGTGCLSDVNSQNEQICLSQHRLLF